MNNYYVSAGLALKEFATKTNNDMETKLELQQFNDIFKYYPSMIWLRLAEGEIDKIPVCSLPIEPFNIEIKYSEEDDHLLMHIAEMLHVVYLYKQHNLSPVEKVLRFLKWNYEFLLVSESTTMLFTNQPGIKPPQNSGSNDELLFT